MQILMVLLGLLEQIENDQFPLKVKADLKELIAAAPSITSNPRDKTDGNISILTAMLTILLGTVQDLYGIGDETEVSLHPQFLDYQQSQIRFLVGDAPRGIVVLGRYVRTWEEVFYDLCHESLHLLDPVLNIEEAMVSALEEGVAVKFAEQMYAKHIKPYCDSIPVTSPVRAPQSQYFRAYCAAEKIPDDVLRGIRNAFGRFSNINHVNKFRELTMAYLNETEIEVLMAPVFYPRSTSVRI